MAGLAGLALGREGQSGPPARVSGTLIDRAATVSPSPASKTARDHTGAMRAPAGTPRRITIRRIHVDAGLVPLGVNSDGTLKVPTDFGLAGWYRLGTKPGGRGPAVIVGHVDSESGPAVFYRLGTLTRGDLVRVAWRSGASLLFRVYAVREYAKASFPSLLVYGETRGPELRLITCGGSFDAETGHYLDHVVVFARMAPAALRQGQASRLPADTTRGPGLALPRSERPPGEPHFGEVTPRPPPNTEL